MFDLMVRIKIPFLDNCRIPLILKETEKIIFKIDLFFSKYLKETKSATINIFQKKFFSF